MTLSGNSHNTQAAELLSSVKSFGGALKRYRHQSISTGTEMTFAVYLPARAQQQPVPVLYWLSGLTCTDENFNQKAGAHALANELGLAIICPDTSPRGTTLPGEHDNYDFGSGAGFYLNASKAPWDQHYRMYDYVTQELPALATALLPISSQAAISGHSMGGHGALVCALKNPGKYTSVSAFAPISNPSACPWGEKAFAHYLGDDREDWANWDTCKLVEQSRERLPVLIDQGDADEFLAQQLRPKQLQAAFAKAHYPIGFRLQAGYDHSYYFIASFINDHLRFHAKALGLI